MDLARSLLPEVVLMDIRIPGTDGLEATRQIAADPELSGVRVIILTTFEADEYVFEAIRAGASGFLVKDTEPEDLISAIRVVARGDALRLLENHSDFQSGQLTRIRRLRKVEYRRAVELAAQKRTAESVRTPGTHGSRRRIFR